jgi:hypothetical protein
MMRTRGLRNCSLGRPDLPAFKIGVPTGIRTPVLTVKGWCPRPLDDGDNRRKQSIGLSNLVEPGGIEPPTSCMPCKRSPS